MALQNLLVVDDDPGVLSMLRRGLTLEGYRVQVAPDAEAGLVLARSARPDAIILDVMLPGMDGFEACRILRQLGPTPILMLTARDTVQDKIEGLDSGADDYLVKPFALGELLARLRALWRRVRPGDPEILSYEDLRMDIGTRDVRRGDRPLELRTREFELLEFFMQHPRRVLSRDLISERVWGYELIGASNVIDVHVRALREKLEAAGEPRLLQTVRRVGYALRLDAVD
jgi:two-component system, OmpR family, response regulator MprA